MYDNLYIKLAFNSYNSFNDWIVDKARENLDITNIKERIFDQLAEAEEYKEGRFLKAELSAGLSKSGNPEIIEFYIKSIDERESENIGKTAIIVVEL